MDTGDKICCFVFLSIVSTIGGCIVVNNTEMLANHKFEPGDLVYRKDRPETQLLVMDESFTPVVKLTTNGETFQQTIDEDQLELWEGPLIPIDGDKPKKSLPNKGFKEGDIVKFKLDGDYFYRDMVIAYFPEDKNDGAACTFKNRHGFMETIVYDLDTLEKVE